jgi:hypothetical protein
MNLLAVHAKDADEKVANYLKYRRHYTYERWKQAQSSECNSLPDGTLHAAATMAAALRLSSADSLYKPLAEAILMTGDGGEECFWSMMRSPIGKVLTRLARVVSLYGGEDKNLHDCGCATEGLDFVVGDYACGYKQFYRDKRRGYYPKVGGKKASRYLHAVSKVFPYWGQRDTAKLCEDNSDNWSVFTRNLNDCLRGDSLAGHSMLQVQEGNDTLASNPYGDLVRIQMHTASDARYVSGCWPIRLVHYLEELVVHQNDGGEDECHFIDEATRLCPTSTFDTTLHELLSCLREVGSAQYFEALGTGKDPYKAKQTAIEGAMSKVLFAMKREYRQSPPVVNVPSTGIQLRQFGYIHSGFAQTLRYKTVMQGDGRVTGMKFSLETKEKVS